MENMNVKPQKVFLMCGIPGSGKTTAAQKLWKEIGGHYISRDECRFALLSENDDYFAHEDEAYEAFIRIIKSVIKCGDDVIIDATHLTRKSRHKTLVRLPVGDYQTIAVCVEVPLSIALERNAQREGRACVPETAIRNMYKSYQHPNFEECWFDEIWTIDENSNITKVKRVNTNE